MSRVVDTIYSVAQRVGVDPVLAVATAYRESRLNPRAVGDQGSSFGLYQLHRGGQLGRHSPEWAYNPENNAQQALSTMARVAQQHPDWSPGDIAVASQRPADAVRDDYRAEVNRTYQQIKSGQFPPANGATPPPQATPVTTPEATPTAFPAAAVGRLLLFLSEIIGPLLRRSRRSPEENPPRGRPAPGRDSPTSAATGILARVLGFLSLPHLGVRVLAGVFGGIVLLVGIYFFGRSE